ncbi:O-antigen ligase family protein [Rugamonas apoptosis]|uniref:O-antigen ligase family protein n=1 Tax=Rugamonas apoptosis TaxID=2758570 RepID=A0A7W2FE81_9BURK|nr:O-antigen ligase family protein [Rugamonas apoptosis]MBA5690088.1 O-antigen ligase family protein [Rugamonas apoptosis]
MELVIIGVIILLVAFALVFGVALLLHAGHKYERGLLPYVFYPLMFAIGVGVLLSGRNMYVFDEMMTAAPMEKHAIAVWSSRLATLLLLLIPFERIGRWTLAGHKRAAVPLWLMLAFGWYFATNILSGAFLAAHHSFNKEYFMFLGVGVAALLLTPDEGERAIRSYRNGMFVFLLVSIACIAWRPELVMSHNYYGILPGVHVRFAGLSPHANSLGPMALVFLLCLWHTPYASRALTLLGCLVGGGALLLTQSKSSYGAFLLGALCLVYYRHRGTLRQRLLDFQRPQLPVALILMVLAGVALLCAAFMFGGLSDRIARFLGSSAGAELATLTGRDQIWEIAVREWRRSPVFGYGLTIFDEMYRFQIHIPYAYHAHNQFYQCLSATGLVGVAGLLAYTAALLWYAVRTAPASGGLSLALLLLLLARSVSEVPMSLDGFGPEQMMHMLLLMMLGSYWQREAAPVVVATAGAARPAAPQVARVGA